MMSIKTNGRAQQAAARTADYIAHAPEGIRPAALDNDAWIEFPDG